MTKLQSLFFLLAVASQIFAIPQGSAVVYHCGNGVDTCPGPKWTCCGPLLEGIGGTCRKLKPGEVCLF